MNYKDAGLAIYNGISFGGINYGGLCKRQSAAQFCTALIAEGGTLAECQAELAEMEALEDEEVKKACKNSFVGCSLETMNTINVKTVGVTCAANVPTLSGTASTGTVLNNVSFEYGTDVFLSTATSIAGAPGTVTGTGSFTATLPALTDGTYYFRAVSIEPGAESRLDGSIGSFSVTATGCVVLSGGDPAPEGGYKGALEGVVWIDQNRNGVQDADEPGLPFTPLVADLVKAAVGTQSVDDSGSTGGVRTAGVRRMAIAATTDANGFYDIPSLEPGDWTVTAKLLTSALERTYDTGGLSTDWLASAFVPINGVGEADFAAAGNARVSLVVEPTATCTKAKTVEVQWAGVDNKLNTKDDVTFVATVTQ